MRKKSVIVMAIFAVAVALAAFGAVGGVAAEESDSEELLNDTGEVDNDTEEIRIHVTNTTEPVDATIYGIDGDGEETELASGELDAPEGETDSLDAEPDNEMYSEYRVHAEGHSDDADNVDSEVLTTASFGGGGFGTDGLGGESLVLGGIGVLFVVGVWYQYREEL